MGERIIMRAGEALVRARPGQKYTTAEPELILGDINGPVGYALAQMMGQTKGHSRMFALLSCNWNVKPLTMMVPKVTLKDMDTVTLFGGVVQAATARAVLDSVIDGVIPKDQVDHLCIIDLIWLNPGAATDPDLDRDDLYRTNYEATKLAIARAMRNEPSIDQLIENKDKIIHNYFDVNTQKWRGPGR